jgi:hypothetical protein
MAGSLFAPHAAEALHWYAPTWVAWNSWQAFYSLSVEAALRIRHKRLASTHLGYLASADLVEQRDARTGLERAQEALLAAKEANDDLALGWASLYKGWALNSLGGSRSSHHDVERASPRLRPSRVRRRCRASGEHRDPGNARRRQSRIASAVRRSWHRRPRSQSAPLNHRPHSGHRGMPARLSGAGQAGTRHQRGPSVAVRETATVRTDRHGARTPSAMRPWTPRHSGSQRYKAAHPGTEQKRPA